MADVNDPTWGDTGFDESGDDGFFSKASQTPPPPAVPQEQAGTQGARRVIVPPPPSVPLSSAPRPREGRAFRITVGALVALIIALGGVLIWHLFFRVSPGSPSDAPVVVEQQRPVTAVPEPVDVAAVDTSSATPEADVASTSVGSTTEPLAASTAMATKKPPTTKAEPLYVVQVFSSPSRDDADEWLQLLRTKNVGDGYITEQSMKGQTWYRVRFGQFPRREDAESAALKIGVNQPWIARIR